MTKKLLVRRNDGSVLEVPYKPASPVAQRRAYSLYLIREHGYRASEAAMTVAQLSTKVLRKRYQNLLMVQAMREADKEAKETEADQ